MADLKTHELIVSGTTSAAAPSYYPRLMNRLLGTRFKVVEGYKSSQEALLALERGEVEGHCSGSSSATLRARMEPLISAGKVKILAQLGRELADNQRVRQRQSQPVRLERRCQQSRGHAMASGFRNDRDLHRQRGWHGPSRRRGRLGRWLE